MKWNDAMSSSDGSGGMRQALSHPTMLQCNGADPSYLLNHINSDLRNALMKHGVGRPGLWKCIGGKVDECQRKVVGGIAIGGDLMARFFDEFDVQRIRDKMREEVLDELTNQRILKCCNET